MKKQVLFWQSHALNFFWQIKSELKECDEDCDDVAVIHQEMRIIWSHSVYLLSFVAGRFNMLDEEHSCSQNVVLELMYDCYTLHLLNFQMLYNYWSTCLFPFIIMMRLDNCCAYCLINIKEMPVAALALLNWKMMSYRLSRMSQPALSRVYSNIFTYSLEPILLNVSLLL